MRRAAGPVVVLLFILDLVEIGGQQDGTIKLKVVSRADWVCKGLTAIGRPRCRPRSMTTIMTSLLSILKFPESLILALLIKMGERTHEKLAFEEPRLRPTVPYALTISKITLKMLNHGSSALPMIRVRYLISPIFRFVHPLALTSMIQMSQRERASHHMSKAS
jgi:hypothetical protein